MKSAIWISFDLGVRGDYEGLYTWMDRNGAQECGDSLAFLNYEYYGDLMEALKLDLENSVEITKKTRVYIIYRETDTEKIKGKFIIGSRKAAPWSGYAGGTEPSEVDEV